MRAGEVEQGTERDDAGGVDVVVGDVVVTLDMVDVDGFEDAGLLIKIAKVALKVWVVDDPAEVAFEMTVINSIETDQGAKQTPIGFDDLRAEQKPATGEALFQMVERCEDGATCLFVDRLTSGKTGFLNALVEVFVDEIRKLRLFGGNLRGEEIWCSRRW